MQEGAGGGLDMTKARALMMSMWKTAINPNHKDHARMAELVYTCWMGRLPTQRVEIEQSGDGAPRPVTFDLSFLSLEQAMRLRAQIEAANQRLIDVEAEEPTP